MNETLAYANMFARFPFAVRRFVREPITLEDAKRTVRERIARRQDNFVQIVTKGVFENPSSPYLPLMKHAGCALSDFQAMVARHGVEPTLRKLREADVYVTFEELKGRKPIVRKGLTIPTRAEDFDNPRSRGHLASRTGGSTGAAVKVAIDMDHIVARASHRLVQLSAHDLIGVPTSIWRGILPDRTFSPLLSGAITNTLPTRWFSPIGFRESTQWIKYGLGSYYLIACMRAAGVKVPLPEFVPMDQAVVIARWAVDMARQRGRVLLRGGTSRAARIAVAAKDAGLDLTGVTFMGAGEPPTEGKVRQIEQVGARFISNYGMSDAGSPACGCARRVGISDYHLYTDHCALFTYPHRVEAFDVTVPAFNLTTLLPMSPKIMLNVETDDFGIVEERTCGCELESYGYTTHLREIRSYSKLTGEGVTLIGDEMIRILETVLPARFGGTPLDYQLMEDEDAQGFTRLYVIVSPSVALEHERDVVDCVLDALRRSSPSGDATRLTWQNADTLQVKRMAPFWTEQHKYLPLYMPRRYQTAASRAPDKP